MRKVCEVYLASNSVIRRTRRGATFRRPVRMMDARQIHTKSPGDVYWQVDEFDRFDYLAPHLTRVCRSSSSPLTEQLSRWSNCRNVARTSADAGQQHMQEHSGIINVPELMMLASNVDRRHVLADVHSDENLGKFYVENGFGGSDALPTAPMLLLDTQKNRQMRESEVGVFTPHGYVVRTEELQPRRTMSRREKISAIRLTPAEPRERTERHSEFDSAPQREQRLLEVQKELMHRNGSTHSSPAVMPLCRS